MFKNRDIAAKNDRFWLRVANVNDTISEERFCCSCIDTTVGFI